MICPALGRLAAVAFVLVAPASSLAGDERPVLRAVAVLVPPFVMEEGGQLAGFNLDLLNEVAARLGARTSYRIAPDAERAFAAVRAGDADVGVNGVFLTVEHEREFDFTYPILDAGLQIMVRHAREDDAQTPIGAFFAIVTSRWFLYWLGALVVLTLVPGHIVWALDLRLREDGTREPYFPGIIRGIEWATQAALGQTMSIPRTMLASVVAHAWMFLGVVFVTFFTAQLTATITLQKFKGNIHGLGDLHGRSVATLTGTPALAPLRQFGALVKEVATADEMFAALAGGDVDAVVSGSAVLRYFATHGGSAKVRVVGPEFRRGPLAFFVLRGSQLRRQIDGALIAMREDGTYDRIREKWFGGD